MARLSYQPNQNPFEQLAHTESLDSDSESDHEVDTEEEDEAEETIDETTTTTTTTEEIHIEEGGFAGDSIFRSTQRESIRQHVSDDVFSISSLSTEVVDVSQALAVPPKRNALGPIPDLRFEQGYLRSISDARTWQKILWITVRDQVVFPLLQGTVWTLLQTGWHCWRVGTHKTGSTVGSGLRRWWRRNVMGMGLSRR